MRTKHLTAALAAVLALATAACGAGGDDASSGAGDARRFDVAMVDVDFEPASLAVAAGEEVRFVFTNDGKLRHEAYVGTPDEQADHAEDMTEGAKDAGGHDDDDHGGGARDDGDKLTVEPGERGELTYRFDEPGTYEIGCHEPGHYDAGMKITVTVTVD